MDKTLEKTKRNLLFELNYGDGLIWISKGIYFLLIIPAIRYSLAFFLLMIFMIPVYRFVRNKYVLPRTGIAKPRLHPRPRNYIPGLILGGGSALIIALFGMWALTNDTGGVYTMLWLGLVIFFLGGNWLIFTLNNWDGKHPYPMYERILVLILLLILPLGELSFLRLSLMLLVYGLFNLAMGLRQFISFLKNNPVLENEA